MRRHSQVLLAFSLLIAIGCGGGGAAAVSGHVTYKGKPVANADVTFIPESSDGKPASGRTDEGGRYSLSTPTKGDGAIPGKYKIHIIARGPERPPKPGESITGMPGEMMPGEALIPQKYFVADSSGLKFEVKRGTNTANFDLAD